MKSRFSIQQVGSMVLPVLPAAVILYYAIGAFAAGFGIGYAVTRDSLRN